jgi:hypothetical protein
MKKKGNQMGDMRGEGEQEKGRVKGRLRRKGMVEG